MKIIKIIHYRCSEYDESNYYTVNRELTEDELNVIIQNAQTTYLDALAEFDRIQTKAGVHYPSKDIDSFPDSLTIKEAKVLVEKKKQEARLYDEKRSQVAGSFTRYLKEQGIFPVWEHDFGKDGAQFHVDWGHRHGQKLDY